MLSVIGKYNKETTMDSLWVKVAVAAFVLGLSGCGGGGSNSSQPDTPISTPSNKAPIAKIEADSLEITAFDKITLSGENSTDPDGDELSYQWKFFDESGAQVDFRIESDNGKTNYDVNIITEQAFHFNPEMWGSYEIELTVSDGKLSDTTKQSIKINPHHRDYPTANIAGVETEKVGATIWLDGEQSTGAHGQQIIYQWELASKPDYSQTQAQNESQAKAFFVPDVAGTYQLTLTVSHVDDKLENNTTFTVIVDELIDNTAPVAVVSVDEREFKQGESVTLDGSKSYDADGDAITYQWQWHNKPTSSDAALNVNNHLAQFTADVTGRFDVKLVVSDQQVESEKVVQINVVNGNVAPIAEAGENVSLNINNTVVLDGKLSSDPEKQALEYRWRLASRPKNSQYNALDNSIFVAKSTHIFEPDAVGEYVFNLQVYDGQLYSSTDAIKVTVYENARPVAVLPEDIVVYNDDTITIDGSKSFDEENQPLTYKWSIKGKPTMFFGSLSVNHEKASFSPTENGTYTIQLIVNDGEQDSIEETIVVVRETPVFKRAVTGRFVDQGGNPIAGVEIESVRGTKARANANGEFTITLQSEREHDGVFNTIDLTYGLGTEVNFNLMSYPDGDVNLGDFVLPVEQWKEITVTACGGYSGDSQVALTFRTITLDSPQLLFLSEVERQLTVNGAVLQVLLPATAFTGVYDSALKYTVSTDDGKATFTHEYQVDDSQPDLLNLTVCEPE